MEYINAEYEKYLEEKKLYSTCSELLCPQKLVIHLLSRIHLLVTLSSVKSKSLLHFLSIFSVQCNEESKLISDLFSGYNKNIRPVVHPEDKLDIQIKLTLTNLISLVRYTQFLWSSSQSFPHTAQKIILLLHLHHRMKRRRLLRPMCGLRLWVFLLFILKFFCCFYKSWQYFCEYSSLCLPDSVLSCISRS